MSCGCGRPGRPSSPRECSACEAKRKARAYRARKQRGVTVTEATCIGCRTVKAATEFRHNWHRASGLEARCHACLSRQRQARAFSIEEREYDRLHADQEGRCAICGEQEIARVGHGQTPERVRLLAIDHDHRTGRVRGLLCGNCNKGIGNLGDDVDRLLAAVDYLKKHAEPGVTPPLT